MAKKSKENKAEGNDEKQSMMELQEKYMRAQVLDQQMKQMQKYVEAFDQQLSELQGLIMAVKEFGGLKKGDKIYAPLTNGIFLRAALEDPTSLSVNVGNGVVVKKSIPEVVKLLEEQEKDMVQIKSETVSQLEALAKQMKELDLDL